jgi:hypothetical protein
MTSPVGSSWDAWLAGLDPESRRVAEELRELFAHAGADDREGWARSEVSEDIAQLTRYLFLSATWRRMQSAVEHALQSEPARELTTSGSDAGMLESVLRTAVYTLAFDLCYLVDEPDGTTWMENGAWRSDVDENHRRWELREVDPDGTLTGRDVGGLHEDLAETDPSGDGGAAWYRYV